MKLSLKKAAQKIIWEFSPPDTPRTGEQFIFVHSTGRCGTKHLSIVYSGENAYTTHEEEHISTHEAMERYLRRIADTADTSLTEEYVRNFKIPHMLKVLRLKSKKIYFDSGHQVIFGILPSLITRLRGHIKLIRLRRDRLQTALSFVTAPEYQDPWKDRWKTKETIDGKHPRWALRPTDDIAVLNPSPRQWKSLNRFQRYLWYVDEVERQWKKLKDEHTFPSIEVNLEGLSEGGYDRVSDFTGLVPSRGEIDKRHNSTEKKKGLDKPDYSADQMKKLDREYRLVISKPER
jgi:hypothetical protein